MRGSCSLAKPDVAHCLTQFYGFFSGVAYSAARTKAGQLGLAPRQRQQNAKALTVRGDYQGFC